MVRYRSDKPMKSSHPLSGCTALQAENLAYQNTCPNRPQYLAETPAPDQDWGGLTRRDRTTLCKVRRSPTVPQFFPPLVDGSCAHSSHATCPLPTRSPGNTRHQILAKHSDSRCLRNQDSTLLATHR